VVLAAGFAVFSACCLAQAVSYGTVQKWQGFYPTKYADGRSLPAGQTFWDDPIIKASLARTLRPEEFKALTTCWGARCTEERIQIYDNMLAVHVCKNDSKNFRACPQWGAYVFFEMDSGRASVCWNVMAGEEGYEAPASLWLTPGRGAARSDVPVEACTSGTAFQYAIDQKNGKKVGVTTTGLPGAKIER